MLLNFELYSELQIYHRFGIFSCHISHHWHHLKMGKKIKSYYLLSRYVLGIKQGYSFLSFLFEFEQTDVCVSEDNAPSDGCPGRKTSCSGVGADRVSELREV